MTPAELKAAQDALGLTHDQFAPLLGRMDRNLWQLMAGERKISKPVVLLVHAYLAGYRPADWPTSSP